MSTEGCVYFNLYLKFYFKYTLIHLYIQIYILKYFLNFILRGTLHNQEKQLSPCWEASLTPEVEQGSLTVFSASWYRQENLYQVISTTYFSEIITPKVASSVCFLGHWVVFGLFFSILKKFCSVVSWIYETPASFFFFFKFSEIQENKNHLWKNFCRWDLNLVSIYCALSVRITVLASVHLT